MNYKVFLVEDEIVTREGIRDNVDWGAAGFEFCGEAPDGEMALPLIEESKPGLSSALEPMTMRKSTQSLLRTYLGDGPSEAVWNGTIKRGERRTLDAVVMFSDLRGFTAFSENSNEEEIFDALDGYFERFHVSLLPRPRLICARDLRAYAFFGSSSKAI